MGSTESIYVYTIYIQQKLQLNISIIGGTASRYCKVVKVSGDCQIFQV